MDLFRLAPTEPHTYTVIQHLRCLNCGTRWRSHETVHRPTCRGVWWDVDGPPHFYIDGREVSEQEYRERCPVLAEGL